MIEFSSEVNLKYNNVVIGLSSLLAEVELMPISRDNFSSTPRKPSDSTSQDAAIFSVLANIRREVISTCKLFESFITSLSLDLKQKNFLLPVVVPSARSVPFPHEVTNLVSPVKPSHLKRPTINAKSAATALPPVQNPIVTGGLSDATLTPITPASPPLGHRGRSITATTIGGGGGGGNGDQQQAEKIVEQDLSQRIIIAGLYTAFDAMARILRAQNGHVCLVRNYEEAQGVCVFGDKYRLASELRIQLKLGPVGVVIRSGIAANISPAVPTENEPNLLCVPLHFGEKRLESPIGAVTFTRSRDPFSANEESLAFMWAVLAQQLICGYGVDHFNLGFDPFQTLLRPNSKVSQHLNKSSSSLNSLPSQPRASSSFLDTSFLGAEEASVNMTDALKRGATQPYDLVFRSAKPSEFVSVRGGKQAAGPAEHIAHLSFTDLADYLGRLEKSWSKAQLSLRSIETEQIQQLDTVRKGRRKEKELQKQVQEEEKKSVMYQTKFESLKSQLESVIASKVNA
jgi:hypothetical protein